MVVGHAIALVKFNGDRGRLGDVEERSRVLAVEAVHDMVAAADAPPHQPGLQVDGVTVAEPDHVAGPGEGKGGGVDAVAGQEGVGARRLELHQRRKHGEPGHHGGAGPAAVAGTCCTVLVARHRRAACRAPGRPEQELLQVGRRHAGAGRRRAQEQPAFPFRGVGPCLRRDEKHELVEADLANAARPVGDGPETPDRVEEGGRQPRDDVVVVAQGGGVGEPVEREDPLVQVVSGRVDGHPEGRVGCPQLEAAREVLQAGARGEEDAVEVAAGGEGGALGRGGVVAG